MQEHDASSRDQFDSKFVCQEPHLASLRCAKTSIIVKKKKDHKFLALHLIEFKIFIEDFLITIFTGVTTLLTHQLASEYIFCYFLKFYDVDFFYLGKVTFKLI